MIFKTTREEAFQDLENYINNDILNYSKQRNFDFGPSKRKNVSCLSPYIFQFSDKEIYLKLFLQLHIR